MLNKLKVLLVETPKDPLYASKQLPNVLHQCEKPIIKNGQIFLESTTRGPKLIKWSNQQNNIILKQKCDKICSNEGASFTHY